MRAGSAADPAKALFPCRHPGQAQRDPGPTRRLGRSALGYSTIRSHGHRDR